MYSTIKSISSVSSNVSFVEDRINSRRKYSFMFDPSTDKKVFLERQEHLVRKTIDLSLKDGYIFDQIIFWGRSKEYCYDSAKLFLENKRGLDLHHFILSNNYFGKNGIWNIDKLLGYGESRMTIRLNEKDYNDLRVLTGGNFKYKYTDRFNGEVYSKYAYHITVPFSNIIEISFVDEFR